MIKRIPPHNIEYWVKKNFEYRSRVGKNGPELVIANPFYSNDNKKFNISLNTGKCHDWRGDEWAGPVNPKTGKRNCSFIQFVKLYKNCSYYDAIKDIIGDGTDIKNYLVPYTNSVAEHVVYAVQLPDGLNVLSESHDIQSKAVKKWLKLRGYTDTTIALNRLYSLGMDVYWPYFEFDELVYWQSRSSINKKFCFPPSIIRDKDGSVIGKVESSKGDFLYGFDEIEKSSYVIITEAIFDKNTIGQQALASGGAMLTPNQINKLKILGPKRGVILSPDRDKAGLKSIVSNYNILKDQGFTVYYSLPPNVEYTENGDTRLAKDWNELFQKCQIDLEEIRRLHDDNIKCINYTELIKLKMMSNQ